MSKVITREERLALLAAASGDELIDAADACLAAASSFAVVTPPAVGCVPAQVREPVRRHRFFLGDVLACTAEVRVRRRARLGDAARRRPRRRARDGGARRGRGLLPDLARDVDALCARAAGRASEADVAEWAELSPTIVQFEEL